MNQLKQLEADLGFVREAVRQSKRNAPAAAIQLLWAVIAPIGFVLMDFAPERVPLYWTIAGPAGFLASWLLGSRLSIAGGQVNRAYGLRQAYHWGAMMGAIFLAVPLVATGRVGHEEFAMVATIVIALGYFLAGIHQHRPLIWVGALLLVGYAGLWILTAYRWTFLGALTALALVATALISRPREASDA